MVIFIKNFVENNTGKILFFILFKLYSLPHGSISSDTASRIGKKAIVTAYTAVNIPFGGSNSLPILYASGATSFNQEASLLQDPL